MTLLKIEYKMMCKCEFYFQSKVHSHYQIFTVLGEALTECSFHKVSGTHEKPPKALTSVQSGHSFL